MSKDHLDKETALSVSVSESGISASAKSRLIASVDRLGGALFDNFSARIEGNTAKQRAKTEGEVAVINALVEYGILEFKADQNLTDRAFKQHFRKVIAAQENKEEVLHKAIDVLRHQPLTEEIKGDINEGFYTRFEQYAEYASTDDLRALFGYMLAGEIRKPGTVSAAAMHFASMLDSDTAQLIQRILPFVNRHGHAYIGCMPMPLTINEIAQLELAGFWSSEKTHTIRLGQGEDYAIRQIGEAKAIVIYMSPNTSINIDIAILSSAAKTLVEIMAIPFDVKSFSIFLCQNGATKCAVGDFSILDDEWIVNDLNEVDIS